MDSTSQNQADAAVLKAWSDLEDIINEMTGTLEYEWDGEWRAEIEALNTAYMRLLIARSRQRKAQ